MSGRMHSGMIVAGLIVAAGVATALAQVAPPGDTSPASAEPADGGATPEPDGADGAADAASGAEIAPSVEDAGTAAAPRDARAGRTVQRRREAALVGGWVSSTRDDAGDATAVDDLALAASGEWLRRQSSVDTDHGLVTPPVESSGTWFTENGSLVLLARGSAVDEVLRAAYQIDDRSEHLVLELPGGPATYDRYR